MKVADRQLSTYKKSPLGNFSPYKFGGIGILYYLCIRIPSEGMHLD